MAMSLTKADLKQIQKLIDKSLDKRLKVEFKKNNDLLFARLFTILKEFPTRKEMYDLVHSETARLATKEEVNGLKDDMVEVKQDISLLTYSMQSLTDTVLRVETTLNRHDVDIQEIKRHIFDSGSTR